MKAYKAITDCPSIQLLSCKLLLTWVGHIPTPTIQPHDNHYYFCPKLWLKSYLEPTNLDPIYYIIYSYQPFILETNSHLHQASIIYEEPLTVLFCSGRQLKVMGSAAVPAEITTSLSSWVEYSSVHHSFSHNTKKFTMV